MATAVQVEALWSGLTDNSGSPLAAGKVYTYYAGTSTPVSLYTASDKSTLATNPLILDGNGRAQVWGDGRYKFVVKTSADVTLFTLDNLLYGFDDSTAIWCGAAGGTGNAVTVSAPSVTQYSEGTVSFVASATNTGAVTVNLNSLGAVAVVKGANRIPLVAGDISEGQLVTVAYEVYAGVGRYRLTNFPTVADIQLSRMITASNVAGTNVITAELSPSFYQYEAGQLVRLKAAATNGASVTLNLNGKGAKSVQYKGQALVGGEIQANTFIELLYDGTQFQLLNPSMPGTLRAVPATAAQVQDSSFLWLGTTSGGNNALTASATPAITAYVAGQQFAFIAGYTNSDAATININGVGAKSIFNAATGSAVKANEIIATRAYKILFDGTQFLLLNDVTPIQNGDYVWLGTTAGSAVAQTASATPAIIGYAAGQKFRAKVGASLQSTGSVPTPHTININGIDAKSIVNQDGTNPTAGTWVAGAIIELTYDGTNFVIVNDPGGWQSFGPVLSAGTPMTLSGQSNLMAIYKKTGKVVSLMLDISFTLGGTATNVVNATVPVNSAISQSGTSQVAFGIPFLANGGVGGIGQAYFSTATNIVIYTNPSAAPPAWALTSSSIRLSWSYLSV